ncbi:MULTISPECIES: hypothetical protein [Bacillus]|jgi:uncharacterized protein YneR|uniref:Uncharacterized protein n=2 Tax=Bacillus cereus group TaxID=86661 RepID=Q738M1_BACC1|nr:MULTISPECIES: hypothetical protein [Bacillus]AAS41291.1 conserved hypothetical protein [Bacillus cereus ATCC 10987]KMQ28107.1 hypothetical protein TU53_24035 [Bacillus cereus]KXI55057.1 hypothetical protein ACS95_03810 [Bacillus cereus]KXY71861.1 hypothetical protein AT272_13615 [Bacillus cereus]KYP99885.1 hypothetical protein B4079_5137 [Bacillus cereus]
MKISIDDKALQWFKEELRISLEIVAEQPDGEIVSVEKEGILFFVDVDDLWYFQNYDLVVGYHEEMEGI